MVGYRVSDANSYVVVTGAGIEDVRIVKKAFVMPFQRANVISISPFDFEITLQAMTIEKLNFSLPAVFTIGPDNNPESLKKYAMLLTGNTDGSTKRTTNNTGKGHVQTIVKGIIEGETRVIVSGMTMEEIFKERQVFKTKIIENVQSELDQFGLKIYNANVKELQDTAGSEYFKVLSRKAHESAANTAKVDVATARMLGEIGEAEKRGKTRQEISKIDAQTAVLETQRKSEKATADAELATTQTRLNMNISIAQIQATRQSEARDAELQRDVETKRADMELERRRAKDVVNAKIEREAAQQKADAKYYTDIKSADGDAYKTRQVIEVAYLRAQKEADAAFYTRKQEAAGISALADAYGHLGSVLGGPSGLLQYLMLQSGTYEKLAESNAKAINGLAPKISVWTTGAEGGDGTAHAGKAIADLYRALPPLLSTVQEQTGIVPPAWLAGMPAVEGANGYQAHADGPGKGKSG